MKRVMLSCVLTSTLLLCISAHSTQSSGVIAGIIRNLDGGTPVAGALVQLENIASFASPEAIRRIVTDSSGRFVFGGLSAGTYRIYAGAQGFISREYGQDTYVPGTQIGLVTDQRISGMNVQLLPVGTISGI